MKLPLKVATFRLDPRDGRAVLILVHVDTERPFPVWLGDDEAAAIARALEGRAARPPGPSDLAHAITRGLGGRVVAAELRAVIGRVVEATLTVAGGDEPLTLPARASDAIALALHDGAPVLIDEDLLAQVAERVREAEARVGEPGGDDAPESLSVAERWNQLLAHYADRGPPSDPM